MVFPDRKRSEGDVWFAQGQPAEADQPPSAADEEPLRIELNASLAARLRRAARARSQSAQDLARGLLARGLEKAALQAQVAGALATLTPRQQQVAWLIARGYTNHQIAQALTVSPETVKTHVHNVLEKFDSGSKAELRVLLLDLGVRWWQSDPAG
jgi:DNA-binding NarL/FixJ family response regulator